MEHDVAAYKGLLMGLFFMTVGMQISVPQLLANFPAIVASICLLMVGKAAIMTATARVFGFSLIQAFRMGLLICSGGEFAFVTFADAVERAVLPSTITSIAYPVVVLSMALTPYLAAFGGVVAEHFSRKDQATPEAA